MDDKPELPFIKREGKRARKPKQRGGVAVGGAAW